MTVLPQPNAIFSCLAAPSYYRDVIVSENEVFVGPDCENAERDGRIRAIKTPGGEYDMAAVVRALPAAQYPDILVVKADVTMRNVPRNLRDVRCPRVLLVGDTHHMERPLRKLARYAMEEPFDAIVMDHTRHHGHFLVKAGLSNVHWIPCFDYVLRPRPLDGPRPDPVIFVGQVGTCHPFRRHVLGTAQAADPRIIVRRAPPEVAADLYAASRISLNCSLNGDLNLRVFEVLGSGGLLFTDRLTRQSGLELLFRDGEHLVTYDGPGDLLEKIDHYLGHPEEAERIRRNGHGELIRNHHPEVKRRQLFDLVFDGRHDAILSLATDRRCVRGGELGPARFQADAALYERLQNLHWGSRSVTLFADPTVDAALLENIADLPRIDIRHRDAVADFERWPPRLTPPRPDVLEPEYVLCLPDHPERSGDLAPWLAPFMGRHVVFSGHDRAGEGRRDAMLAEWGFAPADPVVGFYECRDLGLFLRRSHAADPATAAAKLDAALPALRSPADRMLVAELLVARGEDDRARTTLITAIRSDRADGTAMGGLMRLLLRAGLREHALIVLEEKRRLADGLSREEEEGRQWLLSQVPDGAEAREHRARTTPPTAVSLPPTRIAVVVPGFRGNGDGGNGREDGDELGDMIATWRRAGHAVTVLTTAEAIDANEARTDDAAATTDADIDRAHPLTRLSSPDDHDAMRRNADRIRAAFTARRPDVVVLFGLNALGPDTLDAILAAGLPTAHVIDAVDRVGVPPGSPPVSPLYRPCPDSDALSRALEALGHRLDDPATIPPGARIDHFFHQFQPTLDIPRILCPGPLTIDGGVHVVAMALGMLAKRGVPFECSFVGATPDPQFVGRFRQFCRENGFDDAIDVAGPMGRPAWRRALSRRNLLIASDPTGAHPTAALEAMAAGLTVIARDPGPPRGVIRDGVDGLIFRHDSPEDLAEKLLRLPGDPAAWNRIALAGRDRAAAFPIEARAIGVLEAARSRMIAG